MITDTDYFFTVIYARVGYLIFMLRLSTRNNSEIMLELAHPNNQTVIQNMMTYYTLNNECWFIVLHVSRYSMFLCSGQKYSAQSIKLHPFDIDNFVMCY